MKTPSISLLNSIGFQNVAQKVLYAAKLLQTATVSSPLVMVVAAVKAVAAKPAVIAQTAKPARAASPAIPALENTTGYAFGELYLNSPTYPVGTAIPAISAKAASAAVVGVPAVEAVTGMPAVIAPAIKALPGWSDKISITYAVDSIGIVAYLPYASSPALVGAANDTIDGIQQITPAAITAAAWLDTKASNTPELLTAEVPTLEQYLYKYAQDAVVSSANGSSSGSIADEVLIVNGAAIKCKKITLALSADNFDIESESLQLNKIHLPLITHASDAAYLLYLPNSTDPLEIGITEHVEQRRSQDSATTIVYYYTLATTLLNLVVGREYVVQYFAAGSTNYPYYRVSDI